MKKVLVILFVLIAYVASAQKTQHPDITQMRISVDSAKKFDRLPIKTFSLTMGKHTFGYSIIPVSKNMVVVIEMISPAIKHYSTGFQDQQQPGSGATGGAGNNQASSGF